MSLIKYLIVVALLFVVVGVVNAQDPEGYEYVVQADDWLSKIAEKELGDVLAYQIIADATNAKAAEDDSFATIVDPNVIEVGQKLWIPAVGQGDAAPAPPAPAPAPGNQLTEDQLKNATYIGIYEESVTLTDGVYEGEPFVEGGVARPFVGFIDGSTVYGDLNGDGVDDAAVLLVENSGGSGVFTRTCCVISQSEGFGSGTQTDMGDSPRSNHASSSARPILPQPRSTRPRSRSISKSMRAPV